MKNLGTKDFIEYAYAHWYRKKDLRNIFKLFNEFIFSSVDVEWKFVITWLLTLQTKTTTTTLFPWKEFKKVKLYHSKKLLSLTKQK